MYRSFIMYARGGRQWLIEAILSFILPWYYYYKNQRT